MTLIIEDGTGVHGANAYADVHFVESYLAPRGHTTQNIPEAKIIIATDYIEARFGPRFKGHQKFTLEAVGATLDIEFTGQPMIGESITIGDTTYTFTATATGVPIEVPVGQTILEGVEFLTAAINASHDPRVASAAAVSRGAGVLVRVTAIPGRIGNTLQATGEVAGAALPRRADGGYDAGVQPLSFPREEIYDALGNPITGIPIQLLRATAEYTARVEDANSLLPDPSTGSSGVIRRRERVGPIEEDVTYAFAQGASPIQNSYPAADLLLRDLLKVGGGRVIR